MNKLETGADKALRESDRAQNVLALKSAAGFAAFVFAMYLLCTKYVDNSPECTKRKTQSYLFESQKLARSISNGGDNNYQISFARERVSKTCLAVIAGNELTVRGGSVIQTDVFPVPCTEDVLKEVTRIQLFKNL